MAHLTSAQLGELHALLVKKRAELEHLLAGTGVEVAETEPDPVDVATNATIRDEVSDVAAHARAVLVEVDRALGKMDAGSYGASEESERPIPFARLRTLPWARYTAEEEAARERPRR
jgi:DnaK suppressor protein